MAKTKQEKAAQRGRNIMDAYLLERGYNHRDEADLRDLLTDLMVMSAIDTDHYGPLLQQVEIAQRNFAHEFPKLAKTTTPAMDGPPARMMLVQDDEAMGDNSDLFVLASSEVEAAQMWRAYYELEDGTEPERVIEVPAATAPGAIGWDAVTQHKRKCPRGQCRDTGRGVCCDCGWAI